MVRIVLLRARSGAREGEDSWRFDGLGAAARGGAVDRDAGGGVLRVDDAALDERSGLRCSTGKPRLGVVVDSSRVERAPAWLRVRSGRLVERCDEPLKARVGDVVCALDERSVANRFSVLR